MFKRCFTCQKNKLLIFFKKNNMRYQIPSDKGRMINCRWCETKNFIKNEGRVVRFNFKAGRFHIEKTKVNLINIIKNYFK